MVRSTTNMSTNVGMRRKIQGLLLAGVEVDPPTNWYTCTGIVSIFG